MILFLLQIIIGGILLFEVIAFLTYGSLLSDKKYLDVLIKHMDKGVRFNQYAADIVTLGDLPYITTLPPGTVSCKYYINGLGRIPRWTKMHRELNKLFDNRYR